MEHLSLHDRPQPPPGGPQHQQQMPPPLGPFGPPPPGPAGPAQLPPQMFTTAAQLLDLTDKKLVVVLRDGRKCIGVLRSWDQFGNLVLQDTIERLYGGYKFAEVERGLFLIRGENVLLLGEIDLDKEDDVPEPYQKVDVEEVYDLYKQEQAEKKAKDKVTQKKLKALGFVDGDVSGDIL